MTKNGRESTRLNNRSMMLAITITEEDKLQVFLSLISNKGSISYKEIPFNSKQPTIKIQEVA